MADARQRIVAVLCLVLCGEAGAQERARRAARPAGEYRGESTREDRLPLGAALAGLGLAPGQNVLDIGAGEGYLTLPIARRLGDGGRVYATDVDEDALGRLREAAAREGLANVEPVLVAKEGLDEFYRGKSFDRIVLSHVLEYLHDPVGYLDQLRPSLDDRAGRLFVIHPKPATGLSPLQVKNPDAVAAVLVAKGTRYPVFERLEAPLRELVAAGAKRGLPPPEREALVARLVEIAADPALYPDLARYSLRETGDTRALLRGVSPPDVELAKWLVVRLDAQGTFGKLPREIHGLERAELLLLNHVLLASAFPSGIVRRYNVGNRFIAYLDEASVVARLSAAGYRLVRSHSGLPAHFFLEFRRAR
jgi:2-polyprenyl-3-methyl-5-hydroxy-6-metoxy-1,4-benzoquinol methylase